MVDGAGPVQSSSTCRLQVSQKFLVFLRAGCLRAKVIDDEGWVRNARAARSRSRQGKWIFLGEIVCDQSDWG